MNKYNCEFELSRATEGSAGYDVYASEDTIIPSRGKKSVSTSLYLELNKMFYGRVLSRSGLAFKHNIHVGAGVIDSDYRGEVKVLLLNHSDVDYEIKRKDRIAQLIIQPYCSELIEGTLNDTNRGSDGFGSTGK